MSKEVAIAVLNHAKSKGYTSTEQITDSDFDIAIEKYHLGLDYRRKTELVFL